MIIPALITAGILTALYASRAGGPRSERERVKALEVIVDPIKYGPIAPGAGGKRAACANNPACDAYAALYDLGYDRVVYLGSDDADLTQFRGGRPAKFDFDVRGDLRADRDAPSWMLFFPRDAAPTAQVRRE